MNKYLQIFLFFSMAFLLATGNAAAQSDLSRELTIEGSSTVLPVMQEAQLRWQDLHPDVTLSVSGGGSGHGFETLLQDQTDIAPMSRPPKQSELDQADFDVKKQRIGLDALTIIVHPDNPLDNISKENVTAIYKGEVTKWSSFDGISSGDVSPDDIAVYERDQNSGTHDYFNEEFTNEAEINSSDVADYGQYTEQANLNTAVSNTENAIGYSGLAYVDNTIKALKFEGKEPTIEGAKSGDYGLARPLFLVWNGDEDNNLRDEFLDYIMSPEGQYIVRKVGYVNVEEAASSYTEVEAAGLPLSIAPIVASIAVIGLLAKVSNKQ